MNERKITVRGEGNLSLKPDLIIMTMTLETKSEEYKKAVDDATDRINALKDALESAHFQRDSLKTTDFRVNTEYENIQDGRSWKQVFVGYNCIHMLKLEFDMNMKRLDNAVSAISGCGSAPQFEINFSVKNKNEASEQLLANAVANARRKAEILAAAADVSLGDIITIDYNRNDVVFRSETRVMRAAAFNADCAGAGIEPEDIKVSDSVEIVWSIK